MKTFTPIAKWIDGGWVVTIPGYSRFEVGEANPTEEMVRTELAALLDRPANSFDVYPIQRDFVGLGSR